MRKLTFSFFALVLSCSPPLLPINIGDAATRAASDVTLEETSASADTISKRAELTIATDGEPYGLRLAIGVLTFCDRRGGRMLDLRTGQDTRTNRTCPSHDEPNTACDGLNLNISVRAPASESNDIVDVDGWSVPLNGRVHDCAADRKVLAVVTASTVILVDTTKETIKEISRLGGDRVTVSSGWVAWSKRSKITAYSF